MKSRVVEPVTMVVTTMMLLFGGAGGLSPSRSVSRGPARAFQLKVAGVLSPAPPLSSSPFSVEDDELLQRSMSKDNSTWIAGARSGCAPDNGRECVTSRSAMRCALQRLRRRLEEQDDVDEEDEEDVVDRLVTDVHLVSAGEVLPANASRLPLRWLATTPRAAARLYWATPEDGPEVVVAGWGVADMVRAKRGPAPSKLYTMASRLPKGAKYYGGSRFDERDLAKAPEDDWEAFGGHCYVLPQISLEYKREQGSTLELACHVVGRAKTRAREESKLAAMRAIGALLMSEEADLCKERAGGSRVASITEVPTRTEWEEAVEEAVDTIDGDNGKRRQVLKKKKKGNFFTSLFSSRNRLSKVVLARRRTYAYERGKAPTWARLLSELEKDGAQRKQGFRFALERNCSDSAFVGCSPELLFGIAPDGQVRVDALAGTKRRGDDATSDLKLAAELENSNKEVLENRIVQDFVYEALQTLTRRGTLAPSSLTREPKLELLALSNVQHLRCRIGARLAERHLNGTYRRHRRHVSPTRLLKKALHPTPAVAGLPRRAARRAIRNAERFDRGWYAGPFGALGCDSADFCVAIRSALVTPSKIQAYSGAGIVQGSLAANEWAELDYKLKPIHDILLRDHAQAST